MRTILRDNYEPVMGAYHEVLLIDEAQNKRWLFDCDGVFTELPAPGCIENEKGDSETCAISQKAFTDEVDKLDLALTSETAERKAEDKAIWDEIEEIEMSSDVVDIVGTYAELQAYDTSHLKNNDIIKVIADETHNDATSYYRYAKSTDTFSYVGSEGPYYTESEVDVLLSGKQDTLTAGTNITITNNTISATDTTYTHFTGATASTDGVAGLVPAPVAGDEDKVLKGDGTWGTVSTAANTIFYSNSLETGSTRHIYKKADMTDPASMQDIIDANELGQVILRMSLAAEPTTYNDAYLQNIYVASGDYQALFLDNNNYYGYDSTQTSATTFNYGKRELQDKIVAGTNISIAADGKTISATDTTYSAFTGATSLADGTSGLVPAPTAGDEGKVLRGNGTWSESLERVIVYLPRAIYELQSVQPFYLYKDFSLTQPYTWYEIARLLDEKDVVLYHQTSSDYEQKVVYNCMSSYDFVVLDWDGYKPEYYEFNSKTTGNDGEYEIQKFNVQEKLVAGSNISIAADGKTISATDTTYSAFTGATSQIAGSAGLVPAPTTSDVSKVLAGDGTWVSLPSANNISSNDWSGLWQ